MHDFMFMTDLKCFTAVNKSVPASDADMAMLTKKNQTVLNALE